MDSLPAFLRRSLLAAAGTALVWMVLGAGVPAVTRAQDRLMFSNGELIPRPSFDEKDFKQGFQKVFRFPEFPEGQRAGHDSRTGTLSLRYAPGKNPDLVPMHATVDYRRTYWCYACGEEGRDTGPFTLSVTWSGDLEPVDDDPEGRVPARAYAFGPEVIQGMRSTDPKARIGAAPRLGLRLVLVEEIDGKIERTPLVQLILDTDRPPRDADYAADSYISEWFGPVTPEATDEENALTLEGCATLSKGGKGTLTARAKSAGGTYKWSTDDATVLGVSGSAASATVSANSPGRATVRVEYTTKDGETIEAEKSGGVVELRSVNSGAPLPPIGRIDDNGKELPPVSVPVDQNPGDGDQLTFPVADPGVATVVNLGSTLLVQGLREGKTTTQAQTPCGEKTGPIITLEVVRCGPETVQKLREEQRMLRARLESGRKHMAELTGDEEFDRAAREGAADIEEAAVKAAELVAATAGAAGKAGTAVKVSHEAEKALTIGDWSNIVRTAAEGISEGNVAKIDEAVVDATIQVLDLTALGLLKTSVAAAEAWDKLGRDLGTLTGTADEIKQLEEQRKKTYSELDEVERRLYDVCKEKSSAGKEPPPPKEPPPAKTTPKPPAKPAPKAGPPPAEPAKGQGQEPTQPAAGGTPAKPPSDTPQPPAKPGGGGGGLPVNCGCDRWSTSAWANKTTGLATLGGDLRSLGQCVETFQSGSLAGFQTDLTALSNALKGLSGASALPQKEKQARFKAFVTATNGLPESLDKSSAQVALFGSSLKGCGQASQQAGDLLRSTAATAIAEMNRK